MTHPVPPHSGPPGPYGGPPSPHGTPYGAPPGHRPPQRLSLTAAQVGIGRMLLGWLLDLVVVLTVALGVLVGLLVAQERNPQISDEIAGLSALGVVLLAPALYGFCCFNGRSLGTLVTGTAWVADSTARRAGHWRMAWVMWSRIVLGLLSPLLLIGSITGGHLDTPDTWHTQVRVRGTGW